MTRGGAVLRDLCDLCGSNHDASDAHEMRSRLTTAAALLALALPLGAQTRTISFAKETPGKEPKSFVPLVGTWVIAKEGSRNVLFIDGRVWKRGQPAGGLADKARA